MSPKDNPPITQPQLATVIDIPARTVCAIESGQRKLSYAVWSKVAQRTGAVWYPDKECWLSAWPDFKPPLKPYTYEVYQEFVQASMRRPEGHETDVRVLIARLWELFRLVPDWCWWDLFCRFEDFLETCRADFHFDRLKEIEQECVKKCRSIPGKTRDQKRENFRLFYQDQLARQRDLRKPGWTFFNG